MTPPTHGHRRRGSRGRTMSAAARTQRTVGAAVRLLTILLLAGAASGQPHPRIENGSFEKDRYSVWPGYCAANGNRITGWAVEGSAGVNPLVGGKHGGRGSAPFADNGAVPNGRQVLFVQNIGKVTQSVKGLDAAARYRVTYRENARFHRAVKRWPTLTVTVNGDPVVSGHEVLPVDPEGRRTTPYCRVVSADFAPDAAGRITLTFATGTDGGVTVLIDDISLKRIDTAAPADGEAGE